MKFSTPEKINIACAGSKPTIIIGNLMTSIFSQQDLLSSSLTGDSEEAPEILDVDKVNAIKGKILHFS